KVRTDPSLLTWSMTLSPRDLSFAWGRAYAGGFDRPKMISFSDPKEAIDALAKFVEWDERARQNNVEPFRKRLADKCRLGNARVLRAGAGLGSLRTSPSAC